MYAEYRIYAFYQYENSHSLRYSHNQSFWHVMLFLKFQIGQNTEVYFFLSNQENCTGMPGRPWIAILPWVDQRSCEY